MGNKALVLSTIALAIVSFLQVLDTTITNVALVSIAGDLGIGKDESTWIVTSFNISLAIGLPITIWWGKRYGELLVLKRSLLAFSLLSFLCSLPNDATTMVLARFFQGFAAASLYPLTQTLIFYLYGSEKRGKTSGFLAMITLVAPVVGPLVGGGLTEYLSWRWVFWINIPFCVLSYLLLTLYFPPVQFPRRAMPFDTIGFCILSVCVIATQIVLDSGNTHDWFESDYIVVMTLIALLALTAFWGYEQHWAKHRLIDFSLYRSKNFTVGIVCFVVAFGVFFSMSVIMTIWMRTVLNYAPILAGVAIIPSGIVPVILSPILGRYIGALRIKPVLLISYAIMAGSCFIRAQFDSEIDFASVVLYQFILGFATAPFFMFSMRLIFSSIEQRHLLDASMQATFFRTIVAGFATSLMSYCWTWRSNVHYAHLSEHYLPDQNTTDILMTLGNQDRTRGVSMLTQLLNRQALQLGFNDVFIVLGVVIVLLMVFIALAGRFEPRRG